MTARFVHFGRGLDPHWKKHIVGNAQLDIEDEGLRLLNLDATAAAYSNAQIDDYQDRPRRDFLWRPPLRLTVCARFSHPGAQETGAATKGLGEETLGGTAGFGFWNDPFLMTGLRTPALPRALWFFYASPPSNLKLDLDTPGWGWKAATIDAARLPFLLLAPAAPIAVPLMRIESFYRRLWPIGQRTIGVCEQAIKTSMAEWHIYTIDWGEEIVRFFVDGSPILICETPPRGPLGMVIWIDNQFMRVTPWGEFGHGMLAKAGRQWLCVEWLSVESRS